MIVGCTLKTWAAIALIAFASIAERSFGQAPVQPALTHAEVLSMSVAAHFSDPCQVDQSPHFVVIYDGAADQAQARAALLEKAYRRFYDAFRVGRFKLAPTDKPLVCLLFKSRDVFLNYAKRADHIDMGWSGGYYSSRTNRIALYEAERWVWQPKATDASQAGADGQVTTGEIKIIPASANVAAVVPPQVSIASTTHEAAHQLAFNSGLQRRGVMYPLWAAEGLATSFEDEQPGKPFGPAYDNPGRRRDLARAWRAGEVLPLEQFAALTRLPPNQPEMINAIYAQAWGLFHYLFTHHRDRLADYLANVAKALPGTRSAAAMRNEFIAAFGPIAPLEREWLAALQQEFGKR